MPLYEYRCGKCGIKFEHLQLSSSEKRPACPKCNAADVVKQFSPFAIAKEPEAAPCGPSRCERCEDSPHCPYAGMED